MEIYIDDKLMSEATELTQAETPKEVIEMALEMIIRIKKQERIKAYQGKLKWEGNLDEMRND